ncbi:MAG: D-alanyl-D-alanine endopeptidase [Oceanospirillaceae bacterium]|nr:D-alanyl-D-alanine endopeptidase [Oceanospirillaceae bacterium]
MSSRLLLSLVLTLSATLSLAATPDPSKLDLASVSVMIKDMDSGEVLYQRNPDRVQPIASITKLMTGLVALDAGQSMKERIPVAVKDVPIMRNVHSRIRIGSKIPRGDALHIALMASENRAAATLGHSYPGGMEAFINNMNLTAKGLSMNSTRFIEPTGLSSENVSTAADLMRLLEVANLYPQIGEASSSSKKDVTFSKPRYILAFFNTNTLVNKKSWSVQLSKTGYTDDAGRCLVMRTRIAGRNIGLVLLDSYGKRTHLADAQRIKRWLETGSSGSVPKGAANYRDAKLKALAKR